MNLVGVYDTTLVAVVDLIQDWPRRGTWLIGLLLVDPAVRRAADSPVPVFDTTRLHAERRPLCPTA